MIAIGWFRKKVKKNADLQDWSQMQILDLGKFLGLDLSQYDDGRLSEVTYFACLKVLSEAVAKLPLTLQRVTDTGGVEDAADSPFYKTVRVRPNPYMTPSSFWEAIENSRNHYGNAYALVIYERTGVSLYPLSSEHMTVRLPQDRRLHQAQDLLYDYVYPETGEQVRFPSESILHFKTSTTFGGILGLSVRDKLRLSLDGAMNSQMVLNELYKNNMTGKAVVQYAGQQEVNTELSRQFIRSMNDYAQGKNGTGKAFIPIPYGTTVTPLSLRLADEQFLELRKYTALQIASAFGIKPNQLNDYEKASYANSEAQQLAFYAETMLSILKQYEEELNYKLLTAEQIAKGYRFKFNVAAVLRGDTKAQVDSLCQGIANGLYTPNEARRMLDLPALEGGDRIYFNGSNVAVEDAGVQYQQQALPDSTEPSKALLKLAESIEKACDCGIMSLKGEDYSTRDEHGRFTGSIPHGGGSSGGGSDSGTESGDTLQDSSYDFKEITDEAIEKVPKVDVFGDDAKNSRYQQANKDLLKEAQKYPVGTEVSIVYGADMKPIKECGYRVGENNGEVKIDNPNQPYHAFHNHPSGNTLSIEDMIGLTHHQGMISISAIGNDGKVFCLSKSDYAKPDAYRLYLISEKRKTSFLGKYSYNDIKDKDFFSKHNLSESDKQILVNQVANFTEKCVFGGEWYGFRYKKS